MTTIAIRITLRPRNPEPMTTVIDGMSGINARHERHLSPPTAVYESIRFLFLIIILEVVRGAIVQAVTAR